MQITIVGLDCFNPRHELAMPRFLLPCLLTVALTGCARVTHRDYETFTAGCPAGWQYLYTEHDLQKTLIRTADVCRKMTVWATPVAKTKNGPRS